LADNVLGVKHSSGIGEHGRIEDAEGYTTGEAGRNGRDGAVAPERIHVPRAARRGGAVDAGTPAPASRGERHAGAGVVACYR